MKLIGRLTSAAAIGATLTLVFAAPAFAAGSRGHPGTIVGAPTVTPDTGTLAPDASFIEWASAAGYGFMWNNTSDTFSTSASRDTELKNNGDCAGGWCEHVTPGGDCLTYKATDDTTHPENCTGAEDQLWYIDPVGSGDYLWFNDYEAAAQSCSGGYDAVLASNGTGDDLTLLCPSNGVAGTNAEWQEN